MFFFIGGGKANVLGPYCAHEGEVFAGPAEGATFSAGQTATPPDEEQSGEAVAGQVYVPGVSAGGVYVAGSIEEQKIVGQVVQGGAVSGQGMCDGD